MPCLVLQAVKAKRREETAAVTVVEVQAVDSVFYLLVQRPETGLLAGMMSAAVSNI